VTILSFYIYNFIK